jgi:hypothetical protein
MRCFAGFCLLLTLFSRAGNAQCRQWNLAADFRAAPNQANPNPDGCGNTVWYFLESSPATFPAHLPASYTLLPEFTTDFFFIPGLEQWEGTEISANVRNKLPMVALNTTGRTQMVGGIIWPPDVIMVHPWKDKLVVVGWKSPITGTVSVAAAFRDLDTTCGNGALWFIDRFDGTTNTTLASASLPGSASLADVPVRRGDFLYFIVDPKSGEHRCDSTALDVVIVPLTGVPAFPPAALAALTVLLALIGIIVLRRG